MFLVSKDLVTKWELVIVFSRISNVLKGVVYFYELLFLSDLKSTWYLTGFLNVVPGVFTLMTLLAVPIL
jgi:hypothetical protein